jgi:hypothetical protein
LTVKHGRLGDSVVDPEAFGGFEWIVPGLSGRGSWEQERGDDREDTQRARHAFAS